jgi:integrase
VPRARTGSVEPLKRAEGRLYYRARVRLADGSRARVDVPEKYSTPAGGKSARERAELYAEALQEREDETGELLAKREKRQADEARQDDPRSGETVKLWADRWIVTRRARGLRSVATDEQRLSTHVHPRLGVLLMTKVTRADLENFVEHLDGRVQRKELSWKTAGHVWGLVTKMMADACGAKQRDLRVREDDPAQGVHGPDRGVRKSKQYLYPAEFLALVSCEDVPLKWRQAFAVVTYLYARAGEGNALQWEDLDLDRSVVHIHRAADRDTGAMKPTKTSIARRMPIEPTLLPLLQAMHDECGGRGRVLAIDATGRIASSSQRSSARSSSSPTRPARRSLSTIYARPASPGAPSAETIR